MLFNHTAFKLTPEERKNTVRRLMETSYPGSHFFIMLIASAIIATAGLVLDNSSIIIGSMLVAPFLTPVLSISLGISLSDFIVIRRSIIILLKAISIIIITSAIVSIFIASPEEINKEIMSRISPSLPYLYVALAAGIAASFSIAKPALHEFLVGVAVSVSLLPPLATTGIGLALFNGEIMIGSFQLFFVNLLGIIFGGMIIFSLMGFYPLRKKAEAEIKKEVKKIQKEKNQTKK